MKIEIKPDPKLVEYWRQPSQGWGENLLWIVWGILITFLMLAFLLVVIKYW